MTWEFNEQEHDMPSNTDNVTPTEPYPFGVATGSGPSRRHFVSMVAATAAAAWLRPSATYAAETGIVETIKHAAANEKVTVSPLRGNISVLMGSGGNIAVL